jgi:hypothetical protein
MVYMHSGVVLISNFFSCLLMPWVKETPSLGFSRDGLRLSAVYLNFCVFLDTASAPRRQRLVFLIHDVDRSPPLPPIAKALRSARTAAPAPPR